MRPVWWRHPWLTLFFVLAVVLAVGFGGHAARLALDWNPAPAPVEAWMTPRYIVHGYGVEPAALAQVLNAQPGESPRDTLTAIAAARGLPVDELTAAVQALVDTQGGMR